MPISDYLEGMILLVKAKKKNKFRLKFLLLFIGIIKRLKIEKTVYLRLVNLKKDNKDKRKETTF